MKDGAVEQAVRRWVIAEYQFRFGPHAYEAETAEAYDRATRRLRKAVTGQKDLGNAYQRTQPPDDVQPG